MNDLDTNINNTESENSQPWLMTFADMMTLLFAFFVLLYSMSSPDPVKMAAIEDAAFSTGFVLFDQVKIYIQIITAMNYIYASHVEDLLQ